MRFLIKVALLLAFGIFMMPVDEAALPVVQGARPVSTFEAVSAAQATVSDLSGFCGRNPSVCEVGGELATTFAWKARAAAQMAYQYFDRKITDQQTGNPVSVPAARNRLQPVAFDTASDPIGNLLTGSLPPAQPSMAQPSMAQPSMAQPPAVQPGTSHQQTLTPADRKIKWRGLPPQG